MTADATALRGTENPAWLLGQAQSTLGTMEYAISDVRRAVTDDKLSVETRLVLVALGLSELDRMNDAVSAALGKVANALRTEPA